jgi:hypothetical protein
VLRSGGLNHIKILVSTLLDPTEHKRDLAPPINEPKVIQELYQKLFIYQFKLNERNLTEGRQGYLVTRTFIPDEKHEKKFLNDKHNKVSNIIFRLCMLNLSCNILMYLLNRK